MKKLLTIIIALAFTTLPSVAKVKDAMFIVKNATPTQTTTAIYNELSKSKIDVLNFLGFCYNFYRHRIVL